jgi:hypothetical protein
MGKNIKGQADHGATPQTTLSKLLFWFLYARKSIMAFLAAGGGAALAQGIATLDLTNLTLNNLWTGLGVGLVSAFIVYWTGNKSKEDAIEEAVASEG